MDDRIDEYIDSQQSPQKEICIYLRRLIHKVIPGTSEEMKWGVPVFSDGKFYIGAFKDSVNLGFSIKGLSDKEIALFQGSGKTMRHIKIRSLDKINDEKLVGLIRMVEERSA